MLAEGWSLAKIKVCSIEIEQVLRISIRLLASHSRILVHIVLLIHWLAHARIHVHTWVGLLSGIHICSRIHVHSRVHVHSMIHCWILHHSRVHCWILDHSILRYLLIRILRILSWLTIVNRLLLVIIVRIVCHIIKLTIFL